jgi:hypothetical protein
MKKLAVAVLAALGISLSAAPSYAIDGGDGLVSVSANYYCDQEKIMLKLHNGTSTTMTFAVSGPNISNVYKASGGGMPTGAFTTLSFTAQEDATYTVTDTYDTQVWTFTMNCQP